MGLFSKLTDTQKSSLLGGAINTAAGFGTALLNQYFNVRNWQRQNEYNLPIQQMARFRQAGLNPNLIYDRGDAGNAQSLPDFQARINPVQAAAEAAQIARQNRLLDAEARKANADAEAVSLDNTNRELRNYQESINARYLASEKAFNLKAMDIQNRLNEGKISLTKAEKELAQARKNLVWSQKTTNDYYNLNIQPLEYQVLDQNYQLGQQRISSGALDLRMKEQDFSVYSPGVGIIKNYVTPLVDAATGVAGVQYKYDYLDWKKSQPTRYRGPYRP